MLVNSPGSTGSSHEGSASLNMTVRRFTSRFGKVLKAGFISALMHNLIALNVFFRFFILCRLTWRKSSIVAFLEAMRAFSSEPWCQNFLHQGSDICRLPESLAATYRKFGHGDKCKWKIKLAAAANIIFRFELDE